MPRTSTLGVQEYRFARRAAVDVLEAHVRARAYSTFSLYGETELAEALECFVTSLQPGEVEWTDENTLVIAQRTRSDRTPSPLPWNRQPAPTSVSCRARAHARRRR